MDGAMFHGKIAQFRVIPFHARKKINLPNNFLDLIGINKAELDELAEEPEPEEYKGKDMHFGKIRLRITEEGEPESEDEDETDYESEV
jgi:hypothetical protein